VQSARITTLDGFRGPAFTAASSGIHQVTYRWQITWSASGSQGGFCPPSPCVAARSDTVKISLFGNLYDKTTGLWLLGGASPQNQSVSVFHGSGVFSHSGSGQNFSVRFNVTLTAGDQYLFLTGLQTVDTSKVSTGCHVPFCFGGATVGAAVNVATGGNRALVLSMSVA
jgi:hypothetical protein